MSIMAQMTNKILNQIFYKNNKFDNINTLGLLDPIFYNAKKVNDLQNSINKPSIINTIYENKVDDKDILQNITYNPVIRVLDYKSSPNNMDHTIKTNTNQPAINITCQIQSITHSPLEKTLIYNQNEPKIHTQTHIEIPNKNNSTNHESNAATTKYNKPTTPFIQPAQGDSLFWSIYMAIHGFNEYSQIARNYGVAELNEKQKISEYISNNPELFKHTNHKLTKVLLKEIMSDFMTNQKSLSFDSLIILPVYYKCTIYIIYENKNTYIRFAPHKENNEKDREIFIYCNHGKYKWLYTHEPDHFEKNIRSQMFEYEHYNQPLKALSHYKICELQDIQTKLNIILPESITKPKKQDIYNAIVNHCM